MTNELQDVLQISASLYEYLGEAPKTDDREQFIEEITLKLDERAEKIAALNKSGFKFDGAEKMHSTLFQLDQGIQERLQAVLGSIKVDLKTLQSTKKNDHSYSNPYGHVQVMDGMYYDKKK